MGRALLSHLFFDEKIKKELSRGIGFDFFWLLMDGLRSRDSPGAVDAAAAAFCCCCSDARRADREDSPLSPLVAAAPAAVPSPFEDGSRCW